MLRTVPQRLVVRGLRCSSRVLNASPRPIPSLLRHYRRKKPPPEDDPAPKVSDYVAKHSPPPNPETPADRIPHQTEEDVATEKIFGEHPPSTQAGLPPEGVPVEEVFNKDSDALEQAPEIIKENSRKSTGEDDGQLPSEQTMPHVTEETIATQRVLTGENAIGASSSIPGEEEPADAVPVQDVIDDSGKPAVMEESSKDDDEPPPPASQLRRPKDSANVSWGKKEVESEPTQTPRNSILDLFGPGAKREAPKRLRPRARVVREPTPSSPLASHKLDASNTDLSDWETSPTIQKWKAENQPIKPDDWATSRRGEWQAERKQIEEEGSLSLPNSKNRKKEMTTEERFKSQQERAAKREVLLEYAQKEFHNVQAPPSRSGTPVEFFNQRIRTEPVEPSPWDYFYPQEKLGKPLRTVEAEEAELKDPYEDLLPNAVAKKKKSDVYDPYTRSEKKMKWPFQYNRDELVSKCVNHIMSEGKKARAEKVMQDMFMCLMERFPRQHPVTVFADAIDRNAPILKILTNRTGMKITQVPIPLFDKQRIRAGMMAMVGAAEAAHSSAPFAVKLAQEVIKTMEGRGPGLPFRIAEHKRGMQNKLNVKQPPKSRD